MSQQQDSTLGRHPGMSWGAKNWNWAQRNALVLVLIAPILPGLCSAGVNIWYNELYVKPRLGDESSGLYHVFQRTWIVYNLTIDPLLIGAWAWCVLELKTVFRCLLRGSPVADQPLRFAHRRVIHLPWLGAGIVGIGFLACIPVFLTALYAAPQDPPRSLITHLTISFVTAGLVAMTHTIFIIELMCVEFLYPIFFGGEQPANTPNVLKLSLRGRGLLWAMSIGVCPIITLLLLAVAPHDANLKIAQQEMSWFAVAVGGIGIGFGLFTAWLVSRLVTQPVEALTQAASRVVQGDLSVHIPLLRADEFGPLIEEFNQMVEELREKERLRKNFGLHVGEQAVQQILKSDGPSGVEKEITVLFLDIRSFTARSSNCSPQSTVEMLNDFFTQMVDAVEGQYGGMVNKFLGDGFMALFGAVGDVGDHADRAVGAAVEMVRRLDRLNHARCGSADQPLQIGVGIHTGSAIIGSIGSPDRMEFTAIGDTINVASRVEALTKTVGEPILITAKTKSFLTGELPVKSLPPQAVKGKEEMLEVYSVALPSASTSPPREVISK